MPKPDMQLHETTTPQITTVEGITLRADPSLQRSQWQKRTGALRRLSPLNRFRILKKLRVKATTPVSSLMRRLIPLKRMSRKSAEKAGEVCNI
jgi:hypothetical protein